MTVRTADGRYTKAVTAKATVAEANAIATSRAQPAVVAARFALLLAIAAFLLSALALTVAVMKR